MTRSQHRSPVTTAQPVPARWGGLYLGATARGPLLAGAEHSCLVLGPPRSGKTTSIVIPNLIAAPGAVVSTSTKTDVLAVTARLRAKRGTVWLYDPTGQTPAPPGVTPLRWSPVNGCSDWAAAVARAHALAGAARTTRHPGETSHWIERAEALLAPLLHAAALASVDVAWVLRWVLRHDPTEPMRIISFFEGHEFAGEVLAGIANTDERERSGIFSTTAGLLGAYRDPAALDAAANPNFDSALFARSCDTVYICAPGAAQEQVAPLIVALLDQIRKDVYRRPPGSTPVVWALDEVANIAPIPNLPAIVSEGGSQGLVTLACLQDLSQARTRWGSAADGFLSLFSAKIAFGGIADLATLKLISSLAGDADVQTRAVTKAPPEGIIRTILRISKTTATTYGTQRQPRLPVDEIARGQQGAALLICTAQPPMWVGLLPWWAPPWRDALELPDAPTDGGRR